MIVLQIRDLLIRYLIFGNKLIFRNKWLVVKFFAHLLLFVSAVKREIDQSVFLMKMFVGKVLNIKGLGEKLMS